MGKNKWTEISKDYWKFTTVLDNNYFVKINKEQDKFKEYKYAVYWGTNSNKKQYRQWVKTKVEALKHASVIRRKMIGEL